MKLYTVYQPIIDLESSRILGHEALLRGNASPEELFRRAEQVNRLFQLDIYAMNLAIEAYRNHERGSKLFINCHPASFHHFHSFLTLAIIRNSQIEASQLVIEVTEHQSLENQVKVRNHVKLLKELGVSLAIDDFGHGFNNFSLVELLQPEYIKLDKKLLKNIVFDRSARILLSGIRMFAKETNVKLIAEGIETKEQLDIIQDFGIDLGQGWYLGKPSRNLEVGVLANE